MTRGRTPNADGYITVGVKLRKSLADQLDEARGTTSRSEYLRGLLLNALERVDEHVPTEDETSELLAQVRAVAICPHPKARRSKGLCMACGSWVGDK